MQHVVAPIARAFRPGLIAISAGYDAHRDDPLADCRVETEGYADMAATMRDEAAELGAPLLVCLEGGYDRAALAASVLATIEALGSERQAPAAPAEPARPYIERQRERWPDRLEGRPASAGAEPVLPRRVENLSIGDQDSLGHQLGREPAGPLATGDARIRRVEVAAGELRPPVGVEGLGEAALDAAQ